MNATIIQKMINDSVWQDSKNENIYKFSKGEDFFINDTIKGHYSVIIQDEKVSIVLNDKKSYYVDYINDFILKFYNSNEAFNLMPA